MKQVIQVEKKKKRKGNKPFFKDYEKNITLCYLEKLGRFVFPLVNATKETFLMKT